MRNYSPLFNLPSAPAPASAPGDRHRTMQQVVDALWSAFGDPPPGAAPAPPTPNRRGWSWVGFYLIGPEAIAEYGTAGGDQMLLGPRRDKPACSPIGLYGCCGRSFLSGRALVVHDVRTIGGGYIACDPRDLSEVVVPCIGPNGKPWGVLDVDSFNVGEFDTHDASELLRLLRHTGLSHHTPKLERPETFEQI